MRYASIGKQPRREVNIPELSGGMNLRDSVSMINDNQMTDCQNMWFKDGMLRTRPSFKTNAEMHIVENRATDEYLGTIKPHFEITNGDQVLISATKRCGTKGSGENWYYSVNFFWQGKDTVESIDGISIKIPQFEWNGMMSLYDTQCSHFVAEKDGVLYCYARAGRSALVSKLSYADGGTVWQTIGEADMYVPTVMTHCQRSNFYDYKGVMFEGYNLLTPKFKMIYSAYNENDANPTHPMRYHFCQEIAAEGKISATITYVVDGVPKTFTHTVDANGLKNNTWVYESEPQEDGLTMYACKTYMGFGVEKGSDTMPTKTLNNDDDIAKYGSVEDNLVIEAAVKGDAEERNKELLKVCSMTQSRWFGGSTNGINGGSRLFLCGNTEESEKSLIIWSGLNKPLYFSENNYAYVGNKSQAVTALGRQGENLIIFKEKSCYYSYYVQNNDIDAEDLINQAVVDYEANSVYFPMVTLHSYIGCDCPNTVQLCRNRLVWANSDGKVYTLVSANQYSEMTIYPVSEMIERKIKEAGYSKTALTAAASHDFDGHYILMIGSDAYVMDYNCYGFSHIYGYSKTEDANILIPWYCWQFPVKGAKCYPVGRDIAMSHYEETDTGSMIMSAVLSADNTNSKDTYLQLKDDDVVLKEAPITSSLHTKLFDFSAPNYYKNVDRVSLMLGNNGGAPISVQFVTDAGCEQETVTLNDSEIVPYTAGYVSVQSFNPCVRSITRFGVKLESEGLLAVDGINLLYRLLGGVR